MLGLREKYIMTEKSIMYIADRISMIFMFGILGWYYIQLMRPDKQEAKQAVKTASENAIWHKVETISKIVAAIAALIFAIFKIIELFRK